MTDLDADYAQELRDMYAEDNPDGGQCLNEIHNALTDYVAFANDHQPVAVALWIAATHGLAAWQHATRLVISSPQKRCGKSRLLDILAELSHRTLICLDATVAAIYRSIGDDDAEVPTLIIDEADALWGTKRAAENNEDLRALFNAGWQRNRPTLRCVGPQQTPTPFPTFAMAALAGIGGLPDTIMDRAVVIGLQRRGPGEKVRPYRVRRDGPPLQRLQAKVGTWVRDTERIKRLTEAEPSMPYGIEDRAADAWEPLIAIADEAGGDWPALARSACRALAVTEDHEADLGTLLLENIRDVLTEAAVQFMPSQTLVNELRRIEDSPWTDIDHNLTVSKLARMLRGYRVKPRQGPGKTVRGYYRADFNEAFKRYTRPKPSLRPQNGSSQCEGDDSAESANRPQGVPSRPTRDTSGRVGDTSPISEDRSKRNGQSDIRDGGTPWDTFPEQNEPRCRHCGAELRLPAAVSRGYCSKAKCLAANREGSHL